MAQKVTGSIRLQIPAGKATPASPVGPALGQCGVDIMAFTRESNEHTKNDASLIISIVITVCANRSFSFITKTPPVAILIRKVYGIKSSSDVPNKTEVAKTTREQIKKIVEQKAPDLDASSVKSTMNMVAGTARSIGTRVVD